MLSNVSWGVFFTVLGIAGVIYYAVVLLLYGRVGVRNDRPPKPRVNEEENQNNKRTWQLVSNNERHVLSEMEADAADHGVQVEEDIPYIAPSQEELALDAMASLVDVTEEIITEGMQTSDIASILYKIQIEISRFPELSEGSYRSIVTNLVSRQLQSIAGIEASESQLNMLWTPPAVF
ncbi:hypothetical protein HGH92_26590 [Chitinophaga varians]|uniref:Uncharacterized protein n=1 Tax=Chitinophaga varians TaxID=2202339 RepID=A0A847S882_9BACT|nr:hypothetical protein [Chitinophaga varians]NLR67901.1 hypothetical protein [Chitinophaga varians]